MQNTGVVRLGNSWAMLILAPARLVFDRAYRDLDLAGCRATQKVPGMMVAGLVPMVIA